ncbi:hypothetical protein [Caulobacter sp. NIBR1757]|uniref:5-methylcytosine restriction system specificity protein McrC n=1 Tax=Caulobacter sp. NIBR1757 TaxID=3016000 RepID=UPI0022F120E8|nr:hypothetical protein [Caulobacter sp. NIBR1757]
MDLPLSALIRDGRLELYPHVEAKGLVFVQFRKGRVLLTAGKYVGLIPITPWLSVEVKPKLPVKNIAQILDGARASLGKLPNADRLYDADGAKSPSVFEFLMSNLADSLEEVRVAGLQKEYLSHSDLVSHPRGRIQVAKTVQRCWAKGIRHKVQAQRFEQTSDTSPNRVLKSAIEYGLRGLQRSAGSRDVITKANERYLEFPDQIKPYSARDYSAVVSIVRGKNLPGRLSYYYRALEIALMILSGKTVSLDEIGSELLTDTFIIDFEAVFEDYLRRRLDARSASHIAVRDGNKEGKRPLYDTKQDPPAQPDIVIVDKRTNEVVIAEVKYKEKPDRPDINQAVTYAAVYRCRSVVLVHQSKRGQVSGIKLLGVIDRVSVYSYGFDLANASLDAEEIKFGESLFGLLDQPVVEAFAETA